MTAPKKQARLRKISANNQPLMWRKVDIDIAEAMVKAGGYEIHEADISAKVDAEPKPSKDS